MALAVYVPFPEDDSNSTNHDLVSSLCNQFMYLYLVSDGVCDIHNIN